jgi:hypothetical protein
MYKYVLLFSGRSCKGLADKILGNNNSFKRLSCYITIGQKVLNDL